MYGGRKSQASRSLDQGWKALAFVTLLHRPKVVCGFGTLRAMAADGVRTGGDPELAWREGAAFIWVGVSETLAAPGRHGPRRGSSMRAWRGPCVAASALLPLRKACRPISCGSCYLAGRAWAVSGSGGRSF